MIKKYLNPYLLQNNTFSGETLRQKLIVLDEIGSTNDYLKTQTTNFTPLPEWSAIMAKHQNQGRGQRGNTWLVEPGKNLTFSFLIYPEFLKLKNQFSLSVWVSLSLVEWLENLGIRAQIKWPNDIMISGKKVAGFLIENSSRGETLRQSIIGIGLNINQTKFPQDLSSRVTSVALSTGKTQNELQEMCLSLLSHLQQNFTTFKEQMESSGELLRAYNKRLYRRGIWAPFRSIADGDLEGRIESVNADGDLSLRHRNGAISQYRFKEIQYL